jgi:hypothetical protein
MTRLTAIVVLASLAAGCAARSAFVPRPAPALSDPPSVSKAEVDRYLQGRR